MKISPIRHQRDAVFGSRKVKYHSVTQLAALDICILISTSIWGFVETLRATVSVRKWLQTHQEDYMVASVEQSSDLWRTVTHLVHRKMTVKGNIMWSQAWKTSRQTEFDACRCFINSCREEAYWHIQRVNYHKQSHHSQQLIIFTPNL